MTKELENTDTTTETNVDNSTNETKEHMIPSYRLKQESDRRRDAETKLAEYEKADKERADKDKSFEERYNTLSGEFDSYKDNMAKQNLKNELTTELTGLGFPSKIAKLADTSKLTEDTMKDHIKEFTKEFKEFLPADKTETDTTKSTPALSNVQPSSTEVKQQFNGTITGKEVMNDLINKNK